MVANERESYNWMWRHTKQINGQFAGEIVGMNKERAGGRHVYVGQVSFQTFFAASKTQASLTSESRESEKRGGS
eukprot:854762-Amphidinium_carterae.1